MFYIFILRSIEHPPPSSPSSPPSPSVSASSFSSVRAVCVQQQQPTDLQSTAQRLRGASAASNQQRRSSRPASRFPPRRFSLSTPDS